MLLAADIGGTKADLAVYSSASGSRSRLAQTTLPSADYIDLETLLRQFLHDTDLPVSSACLAIAGPVLDGRATVTNLPWTIDAAHIRNALNLSSVYLLNDLESIAYALPILAQADLCTLNVGEKESCGSIAVIAPGTGLGEAFLTWNGTSYRAHASEGGHTDFAPTDARQVGLLQYLLERWDHVSYERVCSGIGLPSIYDYLRDSQIAGEPEWLARELAGVVDRTPVIVQTALDDQTQCQLSDLTLGMFVSILAAEAGNLALKVLATGGVYLGGGIPPRILPALRDGNRFLRAFRNKGRFSQLLTRIPVHVIMNPQAALLGAAHYGLEIAAE